MHQNSIHCQFTTLIITPSSSSNCVAPKLELTNVHLHQIRQHPLAPDLSNGIVSLQVCPMALYGSQSCPPQLPKVELAPSHAGQDCTMEPQSSTPDRTTTCDRRSSTCHGHTIAPPHAIVSLQRAHPKWKFGARRSSSRAG